MFKRMLRSRPFSFTRCLLGVALVLSIVPLCGAEKPVPRGRTGAIVIDSQDAVAHVPIVSVTAQVPWLENTIIPDGDLAEWKTSGISPVILAGEKHASWFKGVYAGDRDLSAAVWLARDSRCFYFAMEIKDDRSPAPDRIEVAFASNESPLITQWRDVGMRYGPDDVHLVFSLGGDETVRMTWAHLQSRMDSGVANNSFGTEAERLAFIEQGAGGATLDAKVLAKRSRRQDGQESITTLEVAVPWKLLTPYVPVSYSPMKWNMAVRDADDESAIGAIGWTPGLLGTYSAAHFTTLEFEPPAGDSGLEAYGQVFKSRFIDQEFSARFSFFNNSNVAREGHLELLAEATSENVELASADVSIPPGFIETEAKTHSEDMPEGRCLLSGRLTLDDGTLLVIPVHAPTSDDSIFIRRLEGVRERIGELDEHAAVLRELCQHAEDFGLDMAYPTAYKTLLEMFVDRCQMDLKVGDSERVLRNCAYLDEVFVSAREYLESVLEDPAKQLRVPDLVAPDQLQVSNGYYCADGKPVFLWGPCTFWYLRQDQLRVAGLGFNSVCPEVPVETGNREVIEYMKAWYRMGISVNAGLGAPDFAPVTKEYPEAANLDQNNFMPFLVQHSAARRAIAEHYRKSVGFFKQFPGVRSYWLWNEPWYLNYSERTRRDFIEQYLKPRYKTVEVLNDRWGATFSCFDDVKLVQWPDSTNYAPWYDFQQFRDDLLSDFFDFLGTTVQGLDPTRPTHTKFMAASLHAFSIERFQAAYDIAGFDGSASDRDIVFLDFCKSLYPSHPLVNTEIHIHYGGRKAVELVAWRLALHGLADGNWWCWHTNPRFSDSLGSAESMHALAMSGLDVRRLFYPYIHALNQKPRRIATLFPDVVERRSDLKLVRLRHELAAAQYGLGLQPFYATESKVADGVLGGHPILLAGESDYVKESTYQGVMDFVKDGGIAIVTRGGFAHNEYGDSRDPRELVELSQGEPYGMDARRYPLGQGHVICIDSISNEPDIVEDGGQVLRTKPLPEHIFRRLVYQRVLARIMADEGLLDAVRVEVDGTSEDGSDALDGFDWRSVELEGGYALCVIPYETQPPFTVKLVTPAPIRRIVNLITGQEIAPDAFALINGPNLFWIELASDS